MTVPPRPPAPRYDLHLQLHTVRAEYGERALKLELTSASGVTISHAYQPTSAGQPQTDIAGYETLRKLEWDGKNLELAAELNRLVKK